VQRYSSLVLWGSDRVILITLEQSPSPTAFLSPLPPTQAQHILEDARRDAQLHHAACNFQKVPGHTYHLYERQNGTTYFSMLEPKVQCGCYIWALLSGILLVDHSLCEVYIYYVQLCQVS